MSGPVIETYEEEMKRWAEEDERIKEKYRREDEARKIIYEDYRMRLKRDLPLLKITIFEYGKSDYRDFMRQNVKGISNTPGYKLLKNNYIQFLDELSGTPMPSREFPLNDQAVKEYIETGKNSKIKSKRLRELLIKNTHYVSSKNLTEYLCQSLGKLIKDLKGRPWVIIMYSKEHETYDYTKSYGWVLRVCLDNCKSIYTNPPLGVMLCPRDWAKVGPLVESGYLKDFVILDDISYSGHQIRSLVAYTREKMEEYKVSGEVKISAVIGAISGTAVFFNPEDEYNIHKIDLYYTKKFNGYRDLLSKDDIEELEESIGDYDKLIGAPNIYSAHKLPDMYSIIVSEIAPLIGGCEMFYKDKLYFDELEPPCPVMPYRRVKYKTKKGYDCYSDYLPKERPQDFE